MNPAPLRIVLLAVCACTDVACGSDVVMERQLQRAPGVMTVVAPPLAGSAALPPPVTPPPAPAMTFVPTPSTFDADHDGFSPAQGDCEDNSAQINPGAYDFPGNGHDEDCQGGDATAAEEACESVAIGSTDPKDAARALGLCRFVTMESKQWGVISARYVLPDGTGQLTDPRQSGLLPSLGSVKPRAGATMLALSSGVARGPGQADYTDDCDMFSLESQQGPTGYPKRSPACPSAYVGEVFDGAALELTIRVPTNAKSFAFDSNFFTYEYPRYICERFNDFFVALLDPKPMNLPDGNIVFDQDGNPVSVNNSLLQVCEPGSHGGKMFTCPQGPSALQGSGFEASSACSKNGSFTLPPLPLFGIPKPTMMPVGAGAATGWLNTTAPVVPGSIIKLRFAIWDSGDPALDSLALIDHFVWSVETPVIETKPVIPE